ncbi:MAG: ArsR/SmtB family transcription factor, partial [Brevibacterium yomogidense]
PYWVLAGLEDRYPDDDVVLYGGTMSTDGGGYRWQYGLPTQTVLDGDFADAAPALSALAHPVRLALLQAVLTGTHATADLAALPGLGTSGQVYHHLNQLSSAGWLRSPRRGRWEVPGERTIPLLALVMAATT